MRKRLSDNADYNHLEEQYALNKQELAKYDADARRQRKVVEEGNNRRRAQLIVDAVDAGLTPYAIGQAVKRTSHKGQTELIEWAFDYLKIDRIKRDEFGDVEF